MKNRILAAFLAFVFVFSFCACGAEEQNVSSNINETETSSVSQKEEEESSSEQSTSSQKTSSVKTESVSPSFEEETSSKKTPSKVTVDRTSSETVSESIKVSVQETAQVGVYHLNTKWTTNYGKDDASRLKELEDVLKEGYFSTLIIESGDMTSDGFWALCEKYDITVWYGMYSFFNSKKLTIDEYIANHDKYISDVRSHPERWERFMGFHFEEYIWRGQTNEDFLAQSEALYKKYGKRNFVVFATGEFTGVEGNEHLIGTSADEMNKILPESFKYLTDVSFDSYGVDVRIGVDYSHRLETWQEKVSPNIVDGRTYYSEHIKLLLRLTGHKANVWFFPTAYTCNLQGGLNGLARADEDYCMAHLRFFTELLEEQECQGGLFLYTYTQFSNGEELGMQSLLVVKNEDNDQTLRPNETKWRRYSALLKQVTEELRSRKANIVTSL